MTHEQGMSEAQQLAVAIARAGKVFREGMKSLAFMLNVAFARLSEEDRETVNRLLKQCKRTRKKRIRKKLRSRIMKIISQSHKRAVNGH